MGGVEAGVERVLSWVILPRKFLAVSRRSGCRPGSLSKPPQLPPHTSVTLYLCTSGPVSR